MTCIALDDEPLALRLLANYFAKTPGLQDQGRFTDPKKALSFLIATPVDLLFLDIDMPEISGLQFLKSLDKPPMVVFTTAFSAYAVDGFDLNAVDFLLKPIGYDRFLKAVNKAAELLAMRKPLLSQNTHEPASISVKSEYHVVQIHLRNIQFVEALDDYVKIHTSGKPVLSRMPLKSVLNLLPENQFIQIHRSYIVPVQRIEWLRNRKVGIAGKEIPVGDKYYELLKTKLGQ